jgi:hypothetical protein
MPTIALIHTVTNLPEVFRPLVGAALPGWSSFNTVDESLLGNTVREGRLSVQTRQRLAQHVFLAAQGGADAVVVTCSTLGEAVDDIRGLSSVPLFRIDQGMADEAVARADRIGVLATLPTTLEPTGRMIRRAAEAVRKRCTVVERLCEGAFARLLDGDRAGHDEMVAAGFRDLAARTDLIVLAQASMAGSLRSLGRTDVPYLTSPELGVAYVARELLNGAPEP